jgi:hypothetical protein
MRLRSLAGLAVLLIVALALTACGGSGGKGSIAGAILVHGEEGNESDPYEREYKCSSGLETVEMPIGKSTETNGASISLTAKSTGEYQQGVTVAIALGKDESLPAFIVSSEPNGWETAVKVKLGLGGDGTYTLATNAYGTPWDNVNIVKVIFCLDRPHSGKS